MERCVLESSNFLAARARFFSMARACSLGLLMVGLVIAACTPLRVVTDFDHSATFGGYHKFSLLLGGEANARNPQVIQEVRDALRAELEMKSFVFVDNAAEADFVVSFSIGSQDRVDVKSLPLPFAGPWWNLESWWGSPYWGSRVDTRVYRQGTLSIDMFDAHSHKPVWHGRGTRELTPAALEHPRPPIRGAVRAILYEFPPHA
jgi:Domain of unknown function (DUF4136)